MRIEFLIFVVGLLGVDNIILGLGFKFLFNWVKNLCICCVRCLFIG